MDASKESAMAPMVRVSPKKEQEPEQERSPATALTSKDDDSKQFPKTEETAGAVAEDGGDNNGEDGGDGRKLPVAAGWPSPLVRALAGMSDTVLECMAKVLMKKCQAAQDRFPLLGRWPVNPPSWWPTGDEPWWPELGCSATTPPPPAYKPVRVLSKAGKVAAVVAMVKNIAPDYERLSAAIQAAPTVTSIITDAEAEAWDAGLTSERDAYIAEHPHAPTPSMALPLMMSLKPEAERMMKRKEPAEQPPPPPPPMFTDEELARIAETEAIKDILKAPGARYYPMPFPRCEDKDIQIMHAPAAEFEDDAENPAIWKEYARKEGSDELVLLRIGRKNGGVEIFDGPQGGSGRLVMDTYESAQAYYASQKKRRSSVGAGTKSSEEDKDNIVASGSGTRVDLHVAVTGVNTREVETVAGGSNQNSSAMIQPKKEMWHPTATPTGDTALISRHAIHNALVSIHTRVMPGDATIGEDNANNEVAPAAGTFSLLAGHDKNKSALDSWFENQYQSAQMDVPDILDDEPDANKDNSW
ncbi:hypothetical protein GUJ93_ZPchr0013g34823 [Zizania palustris]|uniref:Ethylene insensitive 3-like DNA-binding domain-containing protein n=1 Tax=Zizania palustris TaxID=103762 RepID=A0A8J5X4S4_ZIZPA|nr:hypothetical protein GUJ93_ZPchr0013g34823 [Zizania palustris]